jgi:glyoxylase-like metal-dependent hydrolase (beta-lactamase superfamily II)
MVSVIEELLENLYRIEIPLPESPLRSLNAYVIKSSERNLIIDTGFDRKECLEAMEAGLKELAIDLRRTDFFITHLHADHFGLISDLITSNSHIYSNRPDAEFLQSPNRWDLMLEFARMNGFPEDGLQFLSNEHPGRRLRIDWIPDLIVLKNEDLLPIGDYLFRCIETPGHSLGHICLYEPRRKILISGDHLLNDITPNISCWSDQGNPLKLYFSSLDKIDQLEVDLVLPGHRRLFKDYHERIEQLREHHQKRNDEILLILAKGPKNALEVATEMSWDVNCDSWEEFPILQKWFSIGEAIAHLRYLEEKGLVIRKRESEKYIFFRNLSSA